MNIFDLHLAVMQTAIAVPDVAKLEPGEEASLELILQVPMVLPFSTGPGQGPLTVPLGTVRFTIDRETAIDFFREGLKAAEELPRKSDVMIATNLSSVENAHAAMERLKSQ